jgi:signal transduction histidine kinase
MFVLLFGIVRSGSQTIIDQQGALKKQVHQLSSLLAQNRELRARERDASSRAAELNERFLHRIGSDLHDGPAQALGYGLLVLDSVVSKICDCGRKPGTATSSENLEKLRQALEDTLQEIRNLSRGLAIPELAALDTVAILQHAVSNHRRRTHTDVELTSEGLEGGMSVPFKIALYRVVQEALNNAFRHGGGEGQRINARGDGRTLEVEISDSGNGFDVHGVKAKPEGRLGLAGMRERIESLGGSLNIHSIVGQGTRITAQLPLQME